MLLLRCKNCFNNVRGIKMIRKTLTALVAAASLVACRAFIESDYVPVYNTGTVVQTKSTEQTCENHIDNGENYIVYDGPKKPEDDYLEGVVSNVAGNMPGLIQSNGFLSNETVKISDFKLIFQVNTVEGEYTIKVNEWGERSLEALAVAIPQGSRIRFAKGIYYSDTLLNPWMYHYIKRFGPDRIGSIRSTEIYLLSRTESKK